MKTNFYQLLIAGVVASVALPATAQNNGSNSPYSRYGFGLLNDAGQGFNRGMGGVGQGFSHARELNVANPASYAAIDSATFLFDIGASLQVGSLKDGNATASAKNTSLDYITMAFRLGKGLGFSLGLMPFSTIGYSLEKATSIEYAGSKIQQAETYSGEGGLRYLYAGVGWQPVSRVAVGMNLGYLWGTHTHNVLANFSDINIAARRRMYTADIRTYKLDVGLQYVQPIDEKSALTFGFTYGLGHDIRSAAHFYNQTILGTTIKGADSIRLGNAFSLPHSFAFGVVWQYGKKWRVGVDYTLQQWSGLRYPALSYEQGKYAYTATYDQFANRSKIALGAEYTPNAEGLKRSQRIRYRLGMSYTDFYTKVAGVLGPRNYQVTAGVALPIMNFYNNRSFLNLSVGYERVAPRFAGQISENYFRLGIGINFNENWFSKWKVD